ncbi:alkaline phosphatase family protein [Allorhizocola rhizosphaerae]|uniref:alkaline phosphatase family protein n=1 Tax=Allorhizocola rhizosphaerae TaxID=1872709 RepID=UPI000E3C439D|nr:nucleotide pyrophosphatase/phosphodiesterase family protein [Allorhizocola rhizosphaerae]
MRIPDYSRGTLADVLPGALTALGMTGLSDPLGLASTLEGVRRVAVLLVDGMGYHNLPSYAATLAPQRITCGFPSTTPTSLVSFATGVAPGGHGVLSFFAVIPGTDRVLNHTLWTDDPSPFEWQPVPPLYVAAAAQGIPVTVVNRPEFVGSGLTVVTTTGADYRPAAGVDELAAEMLGALAGGGLVYGYHPELDKAGHYAGLTSEAWHAVASEVDALLVRLIDGLPADAALIVTADHGQLDVPSDKRIDLDALPDGVRVIAGEPRVRYLHTEPGAAGDVLESWRALAGHAAMVLSREEIIETGWYGPVDRAFAERIGDVVLVCRDDWALFSPKFDHPHLPKLVAMHGGLTEAEMDIPLFVLKAGSC